MCKKLTIDVNRGEGQLWTFFFEAQIQIKMKYVKSILNVYFYISLILNLNKEETPSSNGVV
jgi:hypothetical protein